MQCAQAPTAGGRWQGGLLQPPNRTLVSLPLCARPALAEAGERGPDAVLTRGGSAQSLPVRGRGLYLPGSCGEARGDPFTPSTRQGRAHLQPPWDKT